MEKLTNGQKNKIRKIIKYNEQIEKTKVNVLFYGGVVILSTLTAAAGLVYLIEDNTFRLFNEIFCILSVVIGSPAALIGVIATLKNIAEKVGLDIKKANLENDLNLVPDYDINQLAKLLEEKPNEDSIFSR